MAAATVTPYTMNVVPIPVEGNEWAISRYSGEWSTVGTVYAAETGKSHYIKKIMIRCATTANFNLGSGNTGDTDVETIMIGSVPLNAASGIFTISFGEKGMKLAAGKPLTLETNTTAPLWIYVEGKTCLG
jgi:hypothetical protein